MVAEKLKIEKNQKKFKTWFDKFKIQQKSIQGEEKPNNRAI